MAIMLTLNRNTRSFRFRHHMMAEGPIMSTPVLALHPTFHEKNTLSTILTTPLTSYRHPSCSSATEVTTAATLDLQTPAPPNSYPTCLATCRLATLEVRLPNRKTRCHGRFQLSPTSDKRCTSPSSFAGPSFFQQRLEQWQEHTLIQLLLLLHPV